MRLDRILNRKHELEYKIEKFEKVNNYLNKVQNADFSKETELFEDMLLDFQTELYKINTALSNVDIDIPLQ